ncbi:MAG: LicD family protein [Clostridia bacterium]|nr:LicD family protein [Clostridia bacterium]
MEQSAQLKLLQGIELENLRMLMDICEKNHLRYYLIGGSLLGAMRHKGFIPWDDDIDVGLPRPDYNRFVKIAKDYLPAHMDVKTMTSDPNYKCYFTRLINNKKKIYWDHGQYTAVIGVWMDVFPLDGLPGNPLLRKLQVFRVKLAKALYKFTQIDYVTTNRTNRPLSERFLIRFAQLTRIGRLMNADKRLKKLDRALQRYDYDTSAYAWNFSGCYGKREIVPHIQLGGSRTTEFEGLQASIPEAAEDYLTSIYGDYMKLPPEDQRKSHEVRFAEE